MIGRLATPRRYEGRCMENRWNGNSKSLVTAANKGLVRCCSVGQRSYPCSVLIYAPVDKHADLSSQPALLHLCQNGNRGCHHLGHIGRLSLFDGAIGKSVRNPTCERGRGVCSSKVKQFNPARSRCAGWPGLATASARPFAPSFYWPISAFGPTPFRPLRLYGTFPPCFPGPPPPAHLRLCMELVSRHHVVSAVTCFTGGLGCRWRLGGPPSVKPRALHTNQFTMPLIDCYWRRIRLCSLLDTYPG